MLVYSQCFGGRLSHHIDNSNLEIAVIIETDNGYAAIEARLGRGYGKIGETPQIFEKKRLEGEEDAPLFKTEIAERFSLHIRILMASMLFLLVTWLPRPGIKLFGF